MRWLALLALAACGGAPSSGQGAPPSPSASVALAERLRTEKLEGHVVVANGSVHPDEASARGDAAPSRAARALTRDNACDDDKPPFSTWSVVVDRGEVVEVEARADDARACHPSWVAVRGFVRRKDVVPVVRSALRVEHPDKTGLALAPGAPVDADAQETLDPRVVMDGSLVAMSHPSVEKVPELSALASFQNGCSATPAIQPARDASDLGGLGGGSGEPCYLTGEAQLDDRPPERVRSGSLRVGGAPHPQRRVSEVAVHASADGQLLVTLSARCGAMRGFVAPREVSTAGAIGCGEGGGGAALRSMFRVRHPAVVTWSDGRAAGVTLADSPWQRAQLQAQGERVCFFPGPLAVPVCVPAKAIQR